MVTTAHRLRSSTLTPSRGTVGYAATRIRTPELSSTTALLVLASGGLCPRVLPPTTGKAVALASPDDRELSQTVMCTVEVTGYALRSILRPCQGAPAEN